VEFFITLKTPNWWSWYSSFSKILLYRPKSKFK